MWLSIRAARKEEAGKNVLHMLSSPFPISSKFPFLFPKLIPNTDCSQTSCSPCLAIDEVSSESGNASNIAIAMRNVDLIC